MSTKTVLNDPFKVFFPLTFIAIIVALLPWLGIIFQLPSFSALPLQWHAFVMINFVAGAAFVGFLLTALPSWCDYRRPLHRHTRMLLLLWVGSLMSLCLSLTIASVVSIVFWVYLTVLADNMLRVSRARNHISFLWVLLGLCCLSILWAINLHVIWLYAQIDMMIIAVVLAHFRVSRVLGDLALSDAGAVNKRFIPNPIYKNLNVALIALLVVINSWRQDLQISGWLSLSVSFIFIARLQEWHHSLLIKQRYVQTHYAVLLSMAIGYLALGLSQLFAMSHVSQARHFIAITGLLGMILIIMSIVGLRHSGLVLRFPRRIVIAIIMVWIAAISRGLFVSLFPGMMTLYIIPTVSLITAFLLYISVFLPIFYQHDTVDPA